MRASIYEAEVKKSIHADVRMISGCQDNQTSADINNVSTFQLPDPAGRSAGACTAALLKVLYAEHDSPTGESSFIEILFRCRDILQKMKFTQIPQFSSSRRISMESTFHIVPPHCTGTRRAVLIGINYAGQRGELSGCHNDVGNIKEYLMHVQGFKERNIMVLMDDGSHDAPTRRNIINKLKELVRQSTAGDAVFVHYSGHGGQLRDKSGDEYDGFDETLIPIDFRSAGHIVDDDLNEILVRAMPSGVTMTCLMDCCHSGTVLDLPYQFIADGKSTEMDKEDAFKDGSNLHEFATSVANIRHLLKRMNSRVFENTTFRKTGHTPAYAAYS